MLVIYKQGDLSYLLSSSLLFCMFPIISTVSPRQIKVKILHLFTSSLKHDISSEFSNVFQYPNLFLLEEWPLLLCLSQRDGPELLSFQDTKQVRFTPVPILSLLFPMPELCLGPFTDFSSDKCLPHLVLMDWQLNCVTVWPSLHH